MRRFVYIFDFNLPSIAKLIQMLIQTDPYVAKWSSLLIPRLVSENDFYRNYFSQYFCILHNHEQTDYSEWIKTHDTLDDRLRADGTWEMTPWRPRIIREERSEVLDVLASE